MRNILAILTAVTALILAGAPGEAAGAEATVLTIAGKMTRPNRGPLDEFRDAFLMHKDKKFTQAFGLTHAALAGLEQTKISARAEGWPAKVELEGPRLADALALAGVAADATIVATALDGYTVELTPEVRAAHDWVLALTADGAPLSIGGRGPVWLLHGTDATAGPETEATWVWALYLLETK